jgi:hypothetical protein
MKREIHIPQNVSIAVSELLDYPPRLAIFTQNRDHQPSARLQVIGLDIEPSFAIFSKEVHFNFIIIDHTFLRFRPTAFLYNVASSPCCST